MNNSAGGPDINVLLLLQGSADSNYSQPSSDLSLDEEKETLRREKERQALSQLEKARVSANNFSLRASKTFRRRDYRLITVRASQKQSDKFCCINVLSCANEFYTLQWKLERRFSAATL